MNKIKSILLLLTLTMAFSNPTRKQFSEAIVQTAKIGNPAVVSIISEKTIKNNYHQFFSPFGNQFQNDDFTNQSLGSGVILDAKLGYIVTNNHVVEDADGIKVVLYDKTELDATIIGTDPLSDLAIIQVESNHLTQITTGTSADLNVGEWVVAIGSPFGLQLNHTVTAGIISAVGRSDVISKLNFENFIQHDAAINPGNSGGALLNLDGELVGINTAIATGGFSRANAGVGFAIPIDQVKRVTIDLINDGKVSRGWLGVSIQDIDSNMEKVLHLDSHNGVLLSDVFTNSPAEKGGLLPHDIIMGINNKRVDNSAQLKNLISAERPEETISIKILRDSKKSTLEIKLGSRPSQKDLISGNLNSNDQFDILGFSVENHETGVIIIDVEKKSNSGKQNIKHGDIIVAIGRNVIQSVNTYNKTISKYSLGDIIMLRIIRNGNARYVAYEIS
ncbi:MAG: PDZ domain-containing protein [Candidatus Marinimicrobia bacterium]|nr:PDZ domain-containing protein [Candidatus Neomarinimicrobiota bacterium]MBT6871114.1 PDZ domain-containing protein [Candidatus Neomarinimicrobiota bacterium]